MTSKVPQSRELNGIPIPSFFYGTAWKEERTRELTELALSAGFTAIDTANQRRHYVESAVGEAVENQLRGGGMSRSELFLQTKFTYARGQDHRLPYDEKAELATQVEQSFASSLAHLQTSYVDSYLLHGPSRSRGLSDADWEVWRAMERLQRAGQARLIGVSNVSLEQLRALFEGAAVKPAFVQNRCFARSGWDREVRAFCRSQGVLYQGFSLLTANARELAHPDVARIVKRLGCTLPELVFRFALDVGMIPLTGTSQADHMQADLNCFALDLSEADCATLERVAELG